MTPHPSRRRPRAVESIYREDAPAFVAYQREASRWKRFAVGVEAPAPAPAKGTGRSFFAPFRKRSFAAA